MHLTIKGHDSGLGLYLDNKPWRFHKNGDDIVGIIIIIVTKGVTAAQYLGTLTDDELERDFA